MSRFLRHLTSSIKTQDIHFTITETELIFFYTFDDVVKYEKELNAAAGRIHRKITAGTGNWSITGSTLSISYDLKKASTFSDVSFETIADLFKGMVE